MEVRHDSFMDERWLELARERGVATVFTDSPKYPSFADLTGPFVYARLMRSVSSETNGYRAKDLAVWAERAATWAAGGDPPDLPHVGGRPLPRRPRGMSSSTSSRPRRNGTPRQRSHSIS